LTDFIIAALLLVGTGFILVSSLGLLRLPDFYTRLHGPSKAATLGVICVLLGSVLFFTYEQDFLRVRKLLAIAFIFLTAPVGVHMLGKAARAKDVPFDKATRIEE
jgi:multicomponent K+:H+ antiporter subunit G